MTELNGRPITLDQITIIARAKKWRPNGKLPNDLQDYSISFVLR